VYPETSDLELLSFPPPLLGKHQATIVPQLSQLLISLRKAKQ